MPISNPQLTIAMPVFNGGRILRLAVQSIVNQSYEDWELLLIDDGSTDGAIDQLKPSLHPRIRIIQDQQNKGLAARLNEAIHLARGRYFARMDHDDICHPDRFELQVKFLNENSSVDLLGAHCITMDEQERLNGALPSPSTHAEICRRPWMGFYLAHPTWIGKTDWFKEHPYKTPAPYYCEDQELLLRACTTSQYHALSEYLLAYRVSKNIPFKESARRRLALFKVQYNYFLNQTMYRQAALSLIALVLRIGIDGLNKISDQSRLRPPQRVPDKISRQEVQFWDTLIVSLKADGAAK